VVGTLGYQSLRLVVRWLLLAESDYTRRVTDQGGVITWDTPVQRDGTITEPFLTQLKAVGGALSRQ